jgi:hypothetical protein
LENIVKQTINKLWKKWEERIMEIAGQDRDEIAFNLMRIWKPDDYLFLVFESGQMPDLSFLSKYIDNTATQCLTNDCRVDKELIEKNTSSESCQVIIVKPGDNFDISTFVDGLFYRLKTIEVVDGKSCSECNHVHFSKKASQ